MRVISLFVISGLLIISGVMGVITLGLASATLTVTTTSDTISNDGLCSLREAIIAANTDSAFHDCPAGTAPE
jgi:CSLREA domain-containing protein